MNISGDFLLILIKWGVNGGVIVLYEINYRKFTLRRRNRMCPEAEQSRRTEARTVHIRSGQLPSTETGLALCTDWSRAEDPGRSRRSELSGSGSAHSGQER